MTLLLYYPSNKRTIAMQTMVKLYVEKGYKLILLTTCERGVFHEDLENLGVKTFTYHIKKNNPVSYYVRHILFLLRFCKSQKIYCVLSHLQPVNIIAVVASIFMKIPVYIFRHHDYPKNKKEMITDYIINKLGKHIIVPSSGVYNMMIKNEKVNPKKISIIPYVYDFSLYASPDSNNVNTIKMKYPAETLFIMVSRLVPEKRHDYVLRAFNRLIKIGKNYKLLIMDDGPEKNNIQKYIKMNDLFEHVFLLGYQPNIIDYIEASDVLLHPSISEASCSSVKEAGLREKIVIVTKGIGDFDDYIIHGINGFCIENTNDEQLLIDTIMLYTDLKETYKDMGKKLKESILRKFSGNESTFKPYLELIHTRS